MLKPTALTVATVLLVDRKCLTNYIVSLEKSWIYTCSTYSVCSTYVSNIICANMCYICAPALNFIFAPYAHWSVGDDR